MSKVADLVQGRPVYSVEAHHTALDAATYMMRYNVGAVPVLKNGELLGIFSERDLMNRMVAGLRSPGMTPVSEVMTPRPRTVTLEETLENCLFMMREFGFRHLPVVDGGKIVGLISLRDILLFDLEQREKHGKAKGA